MPKNTNMKNSGKSAEWDDSKEDDEYQAARSRVGFAAKLDDICKRYDNRSYEDPKLNYVFNYNEDTDCNRDDDDDDDDDSEDLDFDEIDDTASTALSDGSVISISPREEYKIGDNHSLDRNIHTARDTIEEHSFVVTQAASRLIPHLWRSIRDRIEVGQPHQLIMVASSLSKSTVRCGNQSPPKRTNLSSNKGECEDDTNSQLNATFVVRRKTPLPNKGTTVCLNNGQFLIDALQENHRHDALQKICSPTKLAVSPRGMLTSKDAWVSRTGYNGQAPQIAVSDKYVHKLSQKRECFYKVTEKASNTFTDAYKMLTSNSARDICRTPTGNMSHDSCRTPDGNEHPNMHSTPHKSIFPRQYASADEQPILARTPVSSSVRDICRTPDVNNSHGISRTLHKLPRQYASADEQQILARSPVSSGAHDLNRARPGNMSRDINVTPDGNISRDMYKTSNKSSFSRQHAGADTPILPECTTVRTATKYDSHLNHVRPSRDFANDVDNTCHKAACGRSLTIKGSPVVHDLKRGTSAEMESKMSSEKYHYGRNSNSQLNVKRNWSEKIELDYDKIRALPVKDICEKLIFTTPKDKLAKSDLLQRSVVSIGGESLKSDDSLMQSYNSKSRKTSRARQSLSEELYLANEQLTVRSSIQQVVRGDWSTKRGSGKHHSVKDKSDVSHKELDHEIMVKKEVMQTTNIKRNCFDALQRPLHCNSLTKDSLECDKLENVTGNDNFELDSFKSNSSDEMMEGNDDEVLLLDLWEPNGQEDPISHKEMKHTSSTALAFSKFPQHAASETDIKSVGHGGVPTASPPSANCVNKKDLYRTFDKSPFSILGSPVQKLSICSSKKKLDFYKSTQVVWTKY